jgi:hypothetical protein
VEDRKFCFHEIDTATKEPEPPVPDDDDGYEYADLMDGSGNLIKRFRVRKPGFPNGVITADQIQAGSITASKIVIHSATPLDDNSVTFRAEQTMMIKVQKPYDFFTWGGT